MKGWIKLKSKKILGLLLVITLLSASVFGSINVFAASGDTHVALESYMPPVKTLFVDENFEDRGDVGTSLKNVPSTYTYGTAGIEGTIEGDATNKYVSVASNWKSIFPKTDNYESIKNAKTLVVSLKNKNTDNSVKFALQLSEQTVLSFEPTTPSGYNKNELYNIIAYTADGKNPTIASCAGLDNTTWNTIYVVLERVEDSAYVRKVLIDGTDKTVYAKDFAIPEAPLKYNWWGTSTPIRFRTSTLTNCFDDILVYEPQTVYFKDVTQAGLTIVNDSSEPVTGNLFLVLYDTDGNLLMANPYDSGVTVAAGSSQTITAPTGITYPEGIAKAKIFYWNGTALAPICYAAEMSIS